MPPPADPRLASAGRRELAALSAFASADPVPLPFNLQRSPVFLALLGLATALVVAVAIQLGTGIALAAVLGVALAFAVALNEMLGLVLLALLTPITSGLARGLPVPGFRVSEVLVGVVAVILLVSARRVVRWTAFDWLALVYALATFALGAYNLLERGDPFTGDDWGILVGPFQFILLYRAVAVTARTPERQRIVLRLLLLASVPVALLAIGQQLDVLGMRDFVTTLTGSDIYERTVGEAARATGPFPHWHNLAGYLLMIVLVIVALALRQVTSVLPTWALLTIGLLDGIALIQTLSIAPIFGAIAGALLIAVLLGQVARVFVGAAVVVLLAALLFGARLEARYAEQFVQAPGTDRSSFVPQTIQYRYDLWTTKLIPGLEGRWITGYGPDLPPAIQSFPHTESMYIALLYRGGVLLLVIWAALIVAAALAARTASRHPDPLQQALGAAVLAAVLCLVVMQLIQSYFVDSGTPHVLWTLLGLLAFRDVDAAGRASRRRAALEGARS